jgi:TonB family protein
MRSAVSLYEFMPYGAPDLIESRRRHLSHALALASAISVVLYALMTGIAAMIPSAPERAMQTTVVFPREWVEIERHQAVAARQPVRSRSLASEHAAVTPVRDDLAPAPQKIETGTEPIIDDAPIGTVPPGPIATTDAPPEVLPGRTVWVYVEELPRPVHQVKPEYPELPQRAGVEGTVGVYVMVGKDGRVIQAELDEKQQVPMLNEAALAAARQWVFTPGLANGHPVVCWTRIPFRFRLN